MGAKVRAYDPEGMEQAKAYVSGVTFCKDAYDCAQGASALVMTEWEQFRALDFARLKSTMERPVLVDLRNVYRADEMAPLGFEYVGIGRGCISAQQASRADSPQSPEHSNRAIELSL